MAKKLISLILAALMTASVFVSCSNEAAEETEKQEQESTSNQAAAPAVEEEEEEAETTYLDALPEVGYDGYRYLILNSNALTNDWFSTNYINFDEESADVLESAIFRRNRLVEDRFDVIIAEDFQDYNEIRSQVLAGVDEFPLVLITGANALSLAQEGYLYDQMKLDPIDLTKPYWDQNAVGSLTIANRLYYTVGNFITTNLDDVKVFFFNKGLLADYKLHDPYDYVRNMEWTFDTMTEEALVVSDDLNGDGIYNDNDRYGILSWSGSLYPALIFGSGETFMAKDENDKPYTCFYNERFLQVYDKILLMCHGNGDTVTYDANFMQNTHGLSNNHRVQEIMFPNNQALFWNENVAWSKALRDMEMDFGIIPAPMLDSAQACYYVYSGNSFYGMSIPTSVQDVDRASTVLEALNSMSTGIITDAYYDVMLKSKLSRDVESGEMLDIIFSHLIYDFGVVYGIGGIKDSVATMLANGDTDVASFYKRNEKVLTKSIDRAFEKISALDY